MAGDFPSFAKASAGWPDFCEIAAGLSAIALAKAEKMSTFVSVKTLVYSRRYAKFMSTFVYLLRKSLFRKIKHLASKNVYFYILLYTFHV